jgi:hypothetical protein
VVQLVEALRCKLEVREFHFDGVTGISHSQGTKVLGPTQPLTEMSTRNISWGGGGGKGGRYVWLQPYHLRVPIFWKLWEPQPPESLCRPVQGLLHLYITCVCIYTYSVTPIIRKLVIRIGLALQVTKQFLTVIGRLLFVASILPLVVKYV